ncbi:hypothetical protein IFR04_011010 [Cadophora malorum]|uniref:Cytochrome P450 n=1 Tax=Cadophora malorum TaxID=108018 RepID=A0A8H7T6Q1_9HELO|nr:hypothetical protein IFR04_011010 [Cadophora malorum]
MLAPVYGCLFIALLPILYLLELHVHKTASLAVQAEIHVVVVYLTSLFASIFNYRLFFHRLHSFPGPIGARTSKIWHVWKVRNSKNHLLMDELCHRYGTFVRTGPEEVSIFHPEALVAMNAPGSTCFRSDWYDGLYPLQSLANIRNPVIHDQRRRVWDKALSATAVRDYDSRIIKYAEQFDQLIAESVDRPVDVYAKFGFFTSDVMSDLSFGKSFGQLLENKFHHSVLGVRNFMGVFGALTPVPWFGRLGNKPMMQLNGWKSLINYTKASLRERMVNEPPVPDIASYLLSASAGHLKEDSNYLEGDALVLNIVGSDQTATTLIALFAYLARYSKYQDQIFDEIKKISSVTEFLAVLRLPVLKSVIMETLRLWPPLPTGVGRIVPAGGLTIAGRYIPGGTTILAPRYSIARLESCFEKADEFIPERWTTRPEMVIDKRAYNPFSMGRYSCVGQRLAIRKISHLTALLVSKYTVEFGPDDDGTRCFRDMQDNVTMNAGRLDLVFRLRKAD